MRITRVLAVVAFAAALTGCAATAAPDAGDTPAAGPAFVLSSPDLSAEGRLPDWASNTVPGRCEGENRSPALAWEGAPPGTKSFALAMTDPENPTYDHWVVTGIPADVVTLAAAEDGAIADGIVGASWQGAGTYAGVCLDDNPYLYTVYALDESLTGDASTTHDQLMQLIEGHVLAEASLSAMPAAD